MKPEQEKEYLEKYKKAKASGVKFWPDVIYKDLLVAFSLFLVLVLIAAFLGVKPEPPADPSDSSYIPRPEWYFLFLFQLLEYIPGQIEWVGTFLIPTVAVLALLLLPFYDRSPFRHWKKRKLAVILMSADRGWYGAAHHRSGSDHAAARRERCSHHRHRPNRGRSRPVLDPLRRMPRARWRGRRDQRR